jgi:hypothetical protein
VNRPPPKFRNSNKVGARNGKRVKTRRCPMRPIVFAAVMAGAMSVLAPADATARSPLCPAASAALDRSLLAAPPEFDCTFKEAGRTGAGGAGGAGAGAQAEAAQRRKLEYERQCHQQAETILRDRLVQLQAPAGEMIEAVAKCEAARKTTARRSARTTTPRPDRALLVPPSEFACEFKGAGHSEPADLALRRKLEYERQCYRHAEMILRDRVVRLQASLGETVAALDRGDQAAVEQRPRGVTQRVSRQPRAASRRPVSRARLVQWRPAWRRDARAFRTNGSWRARAYFKRDCLGRYDSAGVRC